MLTMGITTASALGIQNAVPWGTITILCIIPPVCTIIIMFFMPESPFYLVSKNKESEAMKSLVWLRGHANDVNSHFGMEHFGNSYFGRIFLVERTSW